MEQYEDLSPTGCCHVYSYGEDTPRLLASRADFIKAVQITAYCSTLFNVHILAFAWMNSHFHFVLKGAADDCQAFGDKVMQLLLLYVNRSRGRKLYFPTSVLVSTKEIMGSRYLKTLICYVLRNPIDAGFKLDPREYEWSSARLYFSGKSDRGEALSDIPLARRRELLGRYTYPGDWTIHEDGLLDYESFVDYRETESLFGGIRGFMIFMAIKKTDIEQLNYQCEKCSLDSLSDEELGKIAEELTKEMHWAKVCNLDLKRKLLLAQKLRGMKGCGKKQLSRVLEIPGDLAERVLT